MNTELQNFRFQEYPPGTTYIQPEWQPADEGGVLLYRQGFYREEDDWHHFTTIYWNTALAEKRKKKRGEYEYFRINDDGTKYALNDEGTWEEIIPRRRFDFESCLVLLATGGGLAFGGKWAYDKFLKKPDQPPDSETDYQDQKKIGFPPFAPMATRAPTAAANQPTAQPEKPVVDADAKVMDIPVLGQGDPAWGALTLGFNDPDARDRLNHPYNIYWYGCLITSMAMMENYYGRGETPLTINQKLVAGVGYTDGGCFVWWKGPSLLGLRESYASPRCLNYPVPEGDMATMRELLDRKIPLLTELHIPTGMHYVLAVGYSPGSGRIYINDPWTGTFTNILDQYGKQEIAIVQYRAYNPV